MYLLHWMIAERRIGTGKGESSETHDNVLHTLIESSLNAANMHERPRVLASTLLYTPVQHTSSASIAPLVAVLSVKQYKKNRNNNSPLGSHTLSPLQKGYHIYALEKIT